MDARIRKRLDRPLLCLTYLIAALGVVFIFSATHGDPTAYYKKQIVFIVLGTFGLVAATLIDYHRLARYSAHIYIANLLILAAVLKVAHTTNGAARWIRIGGFPFQPSEFAKLAAVITLAVFLTRNAATITEFKTFLTSFGYIAVPALLILRQPDLGTALVLFTMWLGMTIVAGAKIQHIAALLGTCSLLFCALWFSGRVIKPYQKERLRTFLNPAADARQGGYHVTQARIAIGSGEMWGKGFLRGSQVHGGYIPERQSDFIFTDVGEEWGFVGTVFVTVLYGFVLARGVRVIAESDEDAMGKLAATGVVTMLAFHVIVNIGMNIGIMPVAGVPLPLISAGGSNVIVTLTSIGMLQSVRLHRHDLMF